MQKSQLDYPEPYPTVQEAYYSAWYYFPSSFKLDQWRNIMQWGEPPKRIGYPTISLRIDRSYGDPAPLCVRIKNKWTASGEHEVKKSKYNELNLPKDKWLFIQVYIKVASGHKAPDGRIIVWLNGEKIIDWENATTRNSNTYWYLWGVGNYGSPGEAQGQYILIDEVKVTSEYEDRTPPIANAGASQTINEDTLFIFDGSDSSDDVGIVSYVWTFSDVTQQTLTGVNSTYTFETPGIHTITLNVTDAAGNWDTDTVEVAVLDVTNPMAHASGSYQRVKVGEAVSFTARGSSDNVGIASYEWGFGDGSEGTGLTTTHTYKEPGTFVVWLTVEDAAGNKDTDSVSVTVIKDTDSASDKMDIDDDGDGMPDAWELSYGLDPLDATDAALDPDIDGLPNLEEYLQGTDPTSYSSPFPWWIFALIVAFGAIFIIGYAIGKRRMDSDRPIQ